MSELDNWFSELTAKVYKHRAEFGVPPEYLAVTQTQYLAIQSYMRLVARDGHKSEDVSQVVVDIPEIPKGYIGTFMGILVKVEDDPA